MTTTARRVLVLGASGMLGHTALRVLAGDPGMAVAGTVRNSASANSLPPDVRSLVIPGVSVTDMDAVTRTVADFRPDVLINCIGVVKQLKTADDPLVTVPINALLPHRLARLAAAANARLIQISTDCVFKGTKGMYVEDDVADAVELYGRSKHIGEVDYPNAITLRTSIIGPELRTAHGLLGWFLSQDGPVKGYRKAVFSGLPTVELSRVIRDVVIPRPDLRGVYHVASEPINKYDLLVLVARTYGRTVTITPDDALAIDRSLDGRRFREATGYVAADWPSLVAAMHVFG